jgi:tRNA-splicing ligase RtcB
VGTQTAMESTFGSTCHGAGRVASRTKSKKTINYDEMMRDLSKQGIFALASNRNALLKKLLRLIKTLNKLLKLVMFFGFRQKL